MSKSGWCLGPEGATLDHLNCPGKFQKWMHGFAGTGRNRKPAIIMLDEHIECGCKCHKKGKKK